MKKNEKKEYKKPEITEYENLNEVTKGQDEEGSGRLANF